MYSYLMAVVANKYRFLSSFTSSLPFSLSTAVLTTASEAATSTSTNLYYEVGSPLNERMTFTVGTGKTITSDGIYVKGVDKVPYFFTNRMSSSSCGCIIFHSIQAVIVLQFSVVELF